VGRCWPGLVESGFDEFGKMGLRFCSEVARERQVDTADTGAMDFGAGVGELEGGSLWSLYFSRYIQYRHWVKKFSIVS